MFQICFENEIRQKQLYLHVQVLLCIQVSWNNMDETAAEVVISGIACRLPESDNIAEFRDHLMNGEDMVTENDSRFQPG